MSHSHFVYPQPTSALTLVHGSPWQVREDEGTYDDDLTSLVDLTDRVIDKLLKAEALSWVLHGSEDYPNNAVAETTSVIADLIHEALDAHREQWEKIRQYAARNR